MSGFPPVGIPDVYNVDANTPFTTTAANGVLSNDIDPETDPLTAIIATQPLNGSVVLNADGSFTYTPNGNFIGADLFTYNIFDGSNTTVLPTTVALTVNALNIPPVGIPDTYLGSEDSPVIVDAASGVLANDLNSAGGSMTATLVTPTLFGTVNLNADGSFTYTPTTNFFGIDTFTYTPTGPGGTGVPTAVVITLNGLADIPVGVPDTYLGTEDSPVVVDAASGVLANDINVDGGAMTATLVTPTLFGTLNLNPDGSFTYTPNANFVGADTFTYIPTSASGVGLPTLAVITLSGLADIPVGVPDTYLGTEDSPVVFDAASGVLANDINVDGGPMTATLLTPTLFGTVNLNPDGSFTYTPNANFVGADSFTYIPTSASGVGLPTVVAITLSGLADIPVGIPDTYLGTEDSPVVVDAASGVLANDINIDGGPMTATLVTPALFGTVNLNADGSFTYTPNANFVGADSFTYIPTSASGVGIPTVVAITLSGLADAPLALPDTYLGVEDTGLTVNAASGVLANDIDSDGDPLTAVLVSNPLFGSLTLNPDGSFVYVPNTNFAGVDTFTYTANDGTSNSLPTVVTLTFGGTADDPIAVADSYLGTQNTSLNVNAANGVLANDIDPDGDPLTAILVSGPTNGALTLNADGSFTYTPNTNFVGVDGFSYRANDGTADSLPTAVVLAVTSSLGAPVAVADAYASSENTALNVNALNGVLANDFDGNADPLTAVLISGPLNGSLTLNADGSFAYTPNTNFNGVDSFSYSANDGTTNSVPATVTLTISGVNNPPSTVSDLYSVAEDSILTVLAATGVLANDSDPEGNVFTATLASQALNGTVVLAADGSFVYTPNADFVGVDSFSYTASDGVATSAPATVTITVTAVEDTVTAVADAYATNEDVTLILNAAAGVLANDIDPDGDTLTANLVTGPSNGTLILNADGSLTYTPNANYSGSDSFTYRANDGTSNSNTVTVSLTINGVNDLPLSANDAYFIDEDAVLTVPALTGVLANDTDVDGDALAAILASLPTNGTVTLNADGSFTYTPNADFSGSDSFTYRANDGTADGNVATVTITVGEQGEAPVITTSAGAQIAKKHKRIVLDPAVQIADPDSPVFVGGSIDASIQSGLGQKDALGYRKGGAKKGLVNAKHGQLRVGRTVIGVLTGGKKGVPLHIELNAQATQDRVELALQSLTFRGTAKQLGTRVIQLQVTDDTANESNVPAKSVDVVR